MIKIDNLSVSIDGKQILSGVSLEFKRGSIYAIMGRNGSGKSTLTKVIAGHPDYEVTSGDISVQDQNGSVQSILDMDPEKRAHLGIFVSFQNPVSIPGLDNEGFLRTVYNNYRERNGLERMDALDFRAFILEKMNKLGMSEEFLERGLNSGFSGGERKKNEIIQLSILNPEFAFLDEIDSGLDVDSLSIICKDINSFRSSQNAFILITHYNRILQYINPDCIYVMDKGRLVSSSNDPKLASRIEEEGFDFLLEGSYL